MSQRQCPACQAHVVPDRHESCPKCGFSFRAAQGESRGSVGAADGDSRVAGERQPKAGHGPPEAGTLNARRLTLAEKRDGLLTGRRWSIDGHGQVGSSNWGDRPAVDLAPCADGKSVSRRHAQLRWAPGQGWLLEDTGTDGRGSTYGTCLNGRRLQPRRPVLVQPGDTLSFGWVLLAVLADEEV